jgi:multimeric flavodoxin WrbA
MKVLGVSGSPIKNSNTDRALKTVLDATGCETELVKLNGCEIFQNLTGHYRLEEHYASRI